MSNTTDLELFNTETSPFDAIRQVDELGEHWSARDMAPFMDYQQWRQFEDVIGKGRAACHNSGHSPEGHIADARKITKNVRGQLREVADYRLTRYGAYLVAQNGDPRKDAVARAQTYFAMQTHKQELAEAAPSPEFEIPQTFAQALRLAAIQAEEIDRLQLRNQQLTVKAEAFDEWINGKGCYLVGTVAKMLKVGPKALWDFLYDEKILIKSPKSKRHREPYAGKPSETWFEVKPVDPKNANGHATKTTFVLPFGAEQIRLLLIRRGLLPSEQLALINGL